MKRQWIIIRGLGREAAHSDDFVAKLKKADPGANVKCVDLPGAGEFYKLSSPLKIDSIAEFVHMQLKQDQPEERYIISVSLGAMVVTSLLHSYPEIANGVIFANTSFANLSPFYHRLQMEAYMHMYRAITATSGEERERAVLDMVSNRPDRNEFVKPWAEIARKRPVSALNFFKQLFAAATYSLSSARPKVAMMLAMVSAHDRMVKPECSQKFAEAWNMPLETHPTAGHELWLDDPDWVIEKAFEFFKIKPSEG